MSDHDIPDTTNPLIGKVDSDAHTMLYSGQRFYYANVGKFEVTINTIAHHLARQNRWLGAMGADFYSVAEHSMLMSDYVYDNMAFPTNRQRLLAALGALMHDSEEFVTGDFPSPLKVLIPELSLYGNWLRSVIFQAFEIPAWTYTMVKPLDLRIRKTEAEYVKNGDTLFPDLERLDVKLKFLAPPAAEYQFLLLFHAITKELRYS